MKTKKSSAKRLEALNEAIYDPDGPRAAAPQSSPRPGTAWSYHKMGGEYRGWWFVMDGSGRTVAKVLHYDEAALIVRRVNQGPAFDAMLEELVRLLEFMDKHVAPVVVDHEEFIRRRNKICSSLALAATGDPYGDHTAALALAQEVSK